MKKMKVFLAGFLAATFVAGAAACGGGEDVEGEKVNLIPIANPAEISPALGYDYYLAAEPLASLKVKMTANSEKPLRVVADLQRLYGGENGYPQAVLVAKNSFIEEVGTTWINEFTSDMAEAAAWLMSETTEISSVVSAVSSHLTEGLTPSLSAANLTKEVIANCGVRFENAWESKAKVNAFLQELIAVSENAAKEVSDNFFMDQNESVSGTETDISAKIFMPDGAPALSMAKFMNENRTGCTFNVVEASTIATYVTGANPVADLCVLPLNAASKLLGTGEKYTMLGTVTHGNLYLLSSSATQTIDSVEELKALKGKRVGTIQINNVPGLTLKLILKKNGLSYVQPSLN